MTENIFRITPNSHNPEIGASGPPSYPERVDPELTPAEIKEKKELLNKFAARAIRAVRDSTNPSSWRAAQDHANVAAYFGLSKAQRAEGMASRPWELRDKNANESQTSAS